MKWFHKHKRRLIVCAVLFVGFMYIVFNHYIFAENVGYMVGDPFIGVGVPADETYVSAFADEQLHWEIAYWSAMIAEYTYAKASYPEINFALTTLGFISARFYSYFDINGEWHDDLMVDVGVRDIYVSGYDPFTLIAIAFRGSVPLMLGSPTTQENMRRNMDIRSLPWRDADATVHRGFYDQYRDFLTYILPAVNETFDLDILQSGVAADPNVNFWITGHSMGAALAELLTLDLVENGVAPQRIITYGFATPLVAHRRLQAHAISIGASDRIFNIVHRRDMVGSIGYGLIRGRSLAGDGNTVMFGRWGLIDRNHHSLPMVYLPFIIAQNDAPLRQQMEAAFITTDL